MNNTNMIDEINKSFTDYRDEEERKINLHRKDKYIFRISSIPRFFQLNKRKVSA